MAVLAACMLEVKATATQPAAIDRVKFLQPQHFYLDQHQEVFRAIRQVVSDGALPDFRMVINKLREAGNIELVGGAHYVMQLTTHASGADNIENHGRKIVEQALKRNLIEIASQIHHEAYEDTTDVFQLLEHVQADIKFLEERETANSGPERIKALWEKLGITVRPDRPEILIKLGEAEVITVGNISLLVGKKKSRKSLLVIYLLWIFLQSRNNLADEVVVFDTEQEEYDVWASRDRLFRMTNQYVPFFCLRGLSPKERRDFIEQTVTHWPCKLKIGVIDGIRDCMSNINDPDETTEVMTWLMRMNVQTKIHFINILHLNKTDGNARGHIGSELLNKAEVTIEVEYDPKTTFSIVKCESSRRKPFENFAFTHSATGLPEIVGVPLKEAVPQDEQIKKLAMVFEDEALKSKELIDAMKTHFNIGITGAKKLIAQYVTRGWSLKSGKDRNPRTTYKLMIDTKNLYVTPPPMKQEPQSELFNSDNRVPEPLPTVDDLPF